MEQQHGEKGEPKEAPAGTAFDATLTKAPKQARVVSSNASTSPAPGFGGESRLDQEEEEVGEEDIDLVELVQDPTRGTPTDIKMCISTASFNGWLMQLSKTCAAAALAGAINASHGRARFDQHAITLAQVLSIFGTMWRTHIDAKKAELMQNVLVNDEITTVRVRELLVALEAGDLTKEETRAAAPPGLEDKVEYISKLIASLANMEGAKPSTASVGTQHLLYAIESFESSHLQLEAHVFLDQISLPQRDLDTWWAALWKIVDDRNSGHDRQPPHGVLLYHMQRHYALIFGLRQWDDASTGCKHRDVLTSKRKQKPKSWVCFDTEMVPLLRESAKAGIVLVRRRERECKCEIIIKSKK